MARPRPSSAALLALVVGAALAASATALSTPDRAARRHYRLFWQQQKPRGAASGGGRDAPAPPTPLVGSAVPDSTGTLRFDPDPAHPGALAHGAFLDARNTPSNFGKLRLVTGSAEAARQRRQRHSGGARAGGHGNGASFAAPSRQRRPHAQDRAEVFASGWLEGWLTAERVYDHWFNMDSYFRRQLNASMERPMAWLKRNDAWVRARIAAARLDDDDDGDDEPDASRPAARAATNKNKEAIGDKQYWAAVDLIVAQADGIAAGYAARSAHEAAKAKKADPADRGARAARAAALAAAAVPPLSADDLLFLNGNGDLYDVIDMYDAIDAGELEPEGEEGEPNRARPAGNPTAAVTQLGPWARRKYGFPALDDDDASDASAAAARIARDVELQGHCSALVKVAADLSDVFFAHSTWDSFTAMTRLYKHLDWSSVAGPAAPLAAPLLSHSGYPGEVASDDDFYLASSGLLVTEATLHVFDPRALRPLVEQRGRRVLSWVRVRAATALASSGAAWVAALAREQSGTYNNAFMVVDLKRFVPASFSDGGNSTTTTPNKNGDGKKQPRLPGLYPGFLWLAEQLPGKLPARDLTSLVALGYAAAYNVPRDSGIYEAAGYPQAAAEAARVSRRDRSYGTPSRLMSYQSSPRAQLFRRDQGLVQTLRDAQRLMRSNAYLTDPLSAGFPVAAVCARGDLIPRGDLAEPKGCYDTKVTSWTLAWADGGGDRPPLLAAEVVGGPTLGGRLAREANDAEDPRDPADGPLPPFRWDPVLHRDFAHRGMHEGAYRFRFERQQAHEDLPLPGDDGGEGGDGRRGWRRTDGASVPTPT